MVPGKMKPSSLDFWTKLFHKKTHQLKLLFRLSFVDIAEYYCNTHTSKPQIPPQKQRKNEENKKMKNVRKLSEFLKTWKCTREAGEMLLARFENQTFFVMTEKVFCHFAKRNTPIYPQNTAKNRINFPLSLLWSHDELFIVKVSSPYAV